MPASSLISAANVLVLGACTHFLNIMQYLRVESVLNQTTHWVSMIDYWTLLWKQTYIVKFLLLCLKMYPFTCICEILTVSKYATRENKTLDLLYANINEVYITSALPTLGNPENCILLFSIFNIYVALSYFTLILF